MAGSNLVRRGVESIEEFMERRRRESENLGRDVEGAAHEALGQAIRAGRTLNLPTPSDVRAYGANLAQARRTETKRAGSSARPIPRPASADTLPTQRPIGQTKGAPVAPPARRTTSLDRNPYAIAAAGQAAQMAGNVGGVIRGAFHTAEGLASGAMFLGRITNPYDRLMSAPGQSAGDQVLGAGKSVADYTKRALANPQIVVDDVRNGAHQLRVDLDSAATPTGQTVREEVDHRLGIGANQGELAWNVGSLAIGGPEINALTGSVPRRS